PIDRVRHRNTTLLAPTCYGIEKGFFIFITELLFPRLPAVDSFINARAFTVADAQNVCRRRIKSLDITKIELLRARHFNYIPFLPAVDRANDGPVRAARPDDFFIHNGKSAEARGRVHGLFEPLGVRRGGKKERCKDKEN